MNQNDFHVMVINNTPKLLSDLIARTRVYKMDGQLKLDRRSSVLAQPTAATDLGAISWPADLSPVHFVKLELLDRDGRIISDNFYWRALPAHPDDFTPLQQLPTAVLESNMSRHDANGNCHLDVTLSNPTSIVALMAHIQLRRQTTHQRVLPAYYSDNYISLVPGESRTITVEAAAQDLGDDQPLIVLDGWNVTTAGIATAADLGGQIEHRPEHRSRSGQRAIRKMDGRATRAVADDAVFHVARISISHHGIV